MLYICFRTKQDKEVFESWYKSPDAMAQKHLDMIIVNLHRISEVPLRDAAMIAMGVQKKG